jgi:hypothetical protein
VDDTTRTLIALLSSGDVESVRVEVLLKPKPQTPPTYTPVISLTFGPDFDPPTSGDIKHG